MAKKTSKSKKKSEEPVAIHVVALAHFERALRAMNEATVVLEETPDLPAEEVRARGSELRKATQSLLEERRRVEELGQKYSVEQQGIDLDDAKDEVERRLARIRDARGAI